MRFDTEGDAITVLACRTVTKLSAAENGKVFEVIGHALDRLVRTENGFRFRERRFHDRTSGTGPWFPDGTHA